MAHDREIEDRNSGIEDPDSGTDVDEEAAYDAAEPASEWHVWLIALLFVAGGAILLAPDWLLPGFVAGLGPLFVLLAVLGWLGQWAFRRYR